MSDHDFLQKLQDGSIRAARKIDDQWIIDTSVKQKILDIIKASPVVDMENGFCDKAALRPRIFKAHEGIRLVPGGSSVRPSYIAPCVVIMPPSFINIGAYVGSHTMIDSHVLVGSCAQIGERVHVSAGVQIGGVLEPINARPVIIEDDCFIGAGVVLTEGMLIEHEAVIASGVFLSASVPIYDVVNNVIIKNTVPARAVVVPGSRPLMNSTWAKDQGLSIACALIVKYRDDKTDAALLLETALR